jgi:hypothetical protein
VQQPSSPSIDASAEVRVHKARFHRARTLGISPLPDAGIDLIEQYR